MSLAIETVALTRDFGAVRAVNAHDFSIRAMSAKTAGTTLALPAGEVDLADNTLVDEFLRSVNDRADEFVSRDTLKAHVAFKNLQVGGANAGEVNPDESGLTVAKSGATASRPYDLRFLGR